MSGHSKWSKVKHQKATTDVVKGAAFTKASRAIMVAVRECGGITDPEKNFRLRLALEKARAVNMPKETIHRAIEKAAGGGGGDIAQVMYEGYGPGGIAFLVDAATDNRNRTVSIIKNTFERHAGSLATPGAVAFLFIRSGVLTVSRDTINMDRMIEAVLDAGGDDVVTTEDMYEIYTDSSRLSHVRQSLEEKGIVIDHAQLIMRPKTLVTVVPEVAERAGVLVADLETLDDVQHVYTNYEL